jgi:superfamily II DNA or RNA helicase
MLQLRTYQEKAVAFLQTRKRGFIVSKAGSGKTIMAAEAVARVAGPFDSVEVLVNTREQVQQMRDALARVQLPTPLHVHVSCVAAQRDVSQADIVVVDECHHLPAKTWWGQVTKASQIVWGFSATPVSGDPERDAVLVDFFGRENFFAVDPDEIRAGGSVLDGVVHIHDVDVQGEFDLRINQQTAAELAVRMRRFTTVSKEEMERRIRWQYTHIAVLQNDARNSRIVEIATSNKAVLVLVSAVDHGKALAERIPGSVVVYSKLSAKKRKEAIQAFRDGTVNCMSAPSLADEGLDVPRAAVLVLAAGGRSAGKLEQRAGRVMRPHASKDFGVVHDFSDRGARMAFAQFNARCRTYRELGYSVKFTQP